MIYMTSLETIYRSADVIAVIGFSANVLHPQLWLLRWLRLICVGIAIHALTKAHKRLGEPLRIGFFHFIGDSLQFTGLKVRGVRFQALQVIIFCCGKLRAATGGKKEGDASAGDYCFHFSTISC
jgi:hypothetical protein